MVLTLWPRQQPIHTTRPNPDIQSRNPPLRVERLPVILTRRIEQLLDPADVVPAHGDGRAETVGREGDLEIEVLFEKGFGELSAENVSGW